MARALWVRRAALLLLACVPALCQNGGELAVGKLLVASRDLEDPNFAKSVILLVRYDAAKGAVGLTINKRSDIPISRAFGDLKEAKGRGDPIYIGGPVELNTVMALLKTSSKPDGASRVFGGVYLISDKDLLTQTLASNADADVFHAYVGYSGWGPGQLEHEVELGAWHILPGSAAIVFHADPDSVWERLIKQTELQIARALTYKLTYTPPLR
jgi:putative transcriptional regulator